MRRFKPISTLNLAWIATVLTIIASALFWHKTLRYHWMPRNFGIVEPASIYRSGWLSPRMLDWACRELNLRTLISLNGSNQNNPRVIQDTSIAQQHGVTRHAFRLRGDGTGDPTAYAQVLKLMADPDNHPLLIHCASGAQRTGVAVLLYRHLIQNVPIEQAYPETFDYAHKPDEWIMLAYLADHLDEIRSAYKIPASPAAATPTPRG